MKKLHNLVAVPGKGAFFMLTKADRAVLDESIRHARMGREAINAIIGKVEDDELALDLNRQACRYAQLEEECRKKYKRERETPPEGSLTERTKLWGGIQVNTLLNASTEHLANMVMQENTKGIADLMKTVKANKSVQSEYYEMAQELMDFEERSIQKLQAYLR